MTEIKSFYIEYGIWREESDHGEFIGYCTNDSIIHQSLDEARCWVRHIELEDSGMIISPEEHRKLLKGGN